MCYNPSGSICWPLFFSLALHEHCVCVLVHAFAAILAEYNDGRVCYNHVSSCIISSYVCRCLCLQWLSLRTRRVESVLDVVKLQNGRVVCSHYSHQIFRKQIETMNASPLIDTLPLEAHDLRLELSNTKKLEHSLNCRLEHRGITCCRWRQSWGNSCSCLWRSAAVYAAVQQLEQKSHTVLSLSLRGW